MAVSTEILRTYRAPRAVIRGLLTAAARDDRPEARVLVWLMAACLLVFVGQWPAARADAMADPSVPFDARIAGALFAWLFVAPLIFYAIAAVSHLVARALGGKGTWFGARVALFWTLLAVSPLMLLQGLVRGFLGAGPELTVVGAVVALAFGVLWLVSLGEAERAP